MHKIYKYLIAFSITLVGFVYFVTAQISDFTTDSCAFAQSLRIQWVYLNPLDSSCTSEFGIPAGWSEAIPFQLTDINMGPHDASFNHSNDTTDVFDSECHWHNHLKGWDSVVLLNGLRQPISQYTKIGWNLGDGGNVIDYITHSSGAGDCLETYLSSYGAIDYSLAVHPINTDFNRDTRMGMSAGRMDTYIGVWGNSIQTNNVQNGTYIIGKYSPGYSHYFNQGMNLFPDNFEIVITISGEYPPNRFNPRTLTLGGSFCDATNPDPQSITVTGNVVSWDSTGACNFNDLEIIIWHEKKNGSLEYRTERTVSITTETIYAHSDKLSDRDLQRWASKIFDPIEEWTFNGGGYSYGYKIGNTIYKP